MIFTFNVNARHSEPLVTCISDNIREIPLIKLQIFQGNLERDTYTIVVHKGNMKASLSRVRGVIDDTIKIDFSTAKNTKAAGHLEGEGLPGAGVWGSIPLKLNIPKSRVREIETLVTCYSED